MKSTKHSTAGVPVIAFRNGALSFLSPPSLNTPAVFSHCTRRLDFVVAINDISACSGRSEPNGCERTTSKEFRFRFQKVAGNGDSPRPWSSLQTGNLPSVAKAALGIFPPEQRPELALPTTLCQGYQSPYSVRALGYKDMPWAKVEGEAPCRPDKKTWLGRNKKSPTTHRHQLKAGTVATVPVFLGGLKLISAGIILMPPTTRGLFCLGLMKPKPVAEPCKCGCGLTVAVCEALFRVGVPSEGLTRGQAGLIMSKLAKNDWRLPEAFAFLKNEGEWFVRRFKGKPAKK